MADFYAAPAIADRLAATLGPEYSTQDWADMNQSLFSALWLEKMAISVTIGLIVIVAALNIIASLVLLVMEKSRDIAILKTMGATRRSVTVDLHAAGAADRPGRHGGWRRARIVAVLGADRYKLIQIPADVYQISARPVCRAALGLRRRRRRRDRHLLSGDHLPVAPGGETGSGAGAAVRMSVGVVTITIDAKARRHDGGTGARS